ncbi:MAG: ABC transporter ATP-binding protein [Pseudomonadota bacterium]
MTSQTPLIQARGLGKTYGGVAALKPSTFDIPEGCVLGVIGANGAGKTTMLNAILGLMSYEGELKVLGRDPFLERAELMQEVCFISDVATLPKWARVRDVISMVERVHPKFDRAVFEHRFAKTKIKLGSRVKTLSKGMTVQLHLAIVMAIDAKLLVLDEPTLGLDIIFRKDFYESLIGEYFDEGRTIIITTHQVEEIEAILSDVMFIREGEIVLRAAMDDLSNRIAAVEVHPDHTEAAMALNPIWRRTSLGRTIFMFEDVPHGELAQFGEVRRVSLSDVFVAKMQGMSPAPQSVPAAPAFAAAGE